MRSFCSAKAFLIFSTKNITVFGYKVLKHLMNWPLNELFKLRMLWTTGPWSERKSPYWQFCEQLRLCWINLSNDRVFPVYIDRGGYIGLKVKTKSVSFQMERLNYHHFFLNATSFQRHVKMRAKQLLQCISFSIHIRFDVHLLNVVSKTQQNSWKLHTYQNNKCFI